jgi:peptidoglycan/LPS O-acetylase OafA/YrhL
MADAAVQVDLVLPGAAPRKLRVLFLDGMRGIAALYVVFHHGYLENNWQKNFGGLHGEVRPFLAVLEFGRLAVDIFIVLSGTCLMMPLVRRDGKRAPLDVWKFFRRRVWRILPPYYAAVAVSLVLIACVPLMGVRRGVHWDVTVPAWSLGVLRSHLLLIFNLSPQWAYKINHALWSIATESQIYVVFAIVLLPIWRRMGGVAPVIFSLIFGVVMYYGVPSTHDARPWYLCLFAMGMWTAGIAFSDGKKSVPWGMIAAGLIVVAAGTALARPVLSRHAWVPDVIVGMAASSLILFCFDHCNDVAGSRPIVLRILESRVAVWLGLISYSLYLIHPPIVALCSIGLGRLGLSPAENLVLMLTVGVGVSVFFGWVFYVLIERWFIPRSDPRRDATKIDGPPSKLSPNAILGSGD